MFLLKQVLPKSFVRLAKSASVSHWSLIHFWIPPTYPPNPDRRPQARYDSIQRNVPSPQNPRKVPEACGIPWRRIHGCLVYLVGGFFSHPSEKYAQSSNWIISPNFRGENKKCLSCHHLVYFHINLPPLKFNSEFTPEKWWERKTILSYWVLVTFQGRAVKLREGSWFLW